MDILKKLQGGDARSLGKVAQVVSEVRKKPQLFRSLIRGILSDDPVLRKRCADAVEKLTAEMPELLEPYRALIISEIARLTQSEVRWSIAQIFPRLKLSAKEKPVVIQTLMDYLHDQSSVVKTFAMQSLADFANSDSKLKDRILPVLETLSKTGTPAMRARGKKILRTLKPKTESKSGAKSETESETESGSESEKSVSGKSEPSEA